MGAAPFVGAWAGCYGCCVYPYVQKTDTWKINVTVGVCAFLYTPCVASRVCVGGPGTKTEDMVRDFQETIEWRCFGEVRDDISAREGSVGGLLERERLSEESQAGENHQSSASQRLLR